MASGSEFCPNAAPVQIRNIAFDTAVSISDMADQIKAQMTLPGLYIFNGNFFGHLAGYSAICQCSMYLTSNDLTKSGTIYFTDGSYVATFTNNSAKVVSITNQ